MKEPHNYRKVGYSMIVISVSLVGIGLIVWAIGDNYHYSSDLMSGQEIDTMTPKTGYNIISFDDSQPVGAKLKLLDHAETNATAFQLKEQHANSESTIIIFGSSADDNKKLVEDEKLIAAQIAQEKASTASAAEKSNQKIQSTPPSTSPPTGHATLTLTEQVNATINPVNQTTTNGTNKSVNLNESIGVTSK
ncbi:MAG: hypothetical protein D4R72_00100 [Nitrosopumilales archaeon]|nr:MAG: hypothetical protein D4R72_00100 [Nitrosopumilales archaeon]